jgi:PilZ domain-containing protein
MSSSAAPVPGKVNARAASVHVDHACNAFLQDCFRQFGIQLVPLPGDPADIFKRQKFEACVVRLYDPDAEKVLRAARSSPSNKNMVIYGIARSTQEALRFSHFGINAILDEPLDRQSVVKVVKATHLLVIHELRRYVRVPVVAEATVETSRGSFPAMTVEVSSGGMSVRCENALPSGEQLKLSANLRGLEGLNLRAYLCWTRGSDHVYGLRFDPTDDRRLKVRRWIDQYLEIV